ncbi:uncharacterized protein LOC135311789 [Phalacrocorax carbo]|uniref:uncharacterized protein LOC135311789 n=1 Tax=Phalacrocorax carbo TaxID=9209 RepID=UPI003119CCD5
MASNEAGAKRELEEQHTPNPPAPGLRGEARPTHSHGDDPPQPLSGHAGRRRNGGTRATPTPPREAPSQAPSATFLVSPLPADIQPPHGATAAGAGSSSPRAATRGASAPQPAASRTPRPRYPPRRQGGSGTPPAAAAAVAAFSPSLLLPAMVAASARSRIQRETDSCGCFPRSLLLPPLPPPAQCSATAPRGETPAAPRGEAAPAAPAGKLSGKGGVSQPGSPPPPPAANHRGWPRADWAAPPPAPPSGSPGPLRRRAGPALAPSPPARPPALPFPRTGLSVDSSARCRPAQALPANAGTTPRHPAPAPGRILRSSPPTPPTAPGSAQRCSHRTAPPVKPLAPLPSGPIERGALAGARGQGRQCTQEGRGGGETNGRSRAP